MNRAPFWLLFVALLVGSVALMGATFSSKSYFDGLVDWHISAGQKPEGSKAKALFDRAVDAGIVVWSDETQSVELRPGREMAGELRTELMSIREEGAVIQGELRRAQALASYVALRVRRPNCQHPCDVGEGWKVLLAHDVDNRAARMAAAAARMRGPGDVPPPPPWVFARLAKEAGAGYADWVSWEVSDDLVFELDDPGVDQVDVIGDFVDAQLAEGWAVIARWCRPDDKPPSRLEAPNRLIACNGAAQETEDGSQLLKNPPIATRLARSPNNLTGGLRLTVGPVGVISKLESRSIQLTDYISLSCETRTVCRPIWRPNDSERRYGQDFERLSPNIGGRGPTIPNIAAAFVEMSEPHGDRDGEPVLSSDARQHGAASVLGEINGREGYLLTAVGALPPDDTTEITLDLSLQEKLNKVFETALKDNGIGNRPYKLPPQGNQASMVILDLAEGDRQGAILAAVGVPDVDNNLSDWDNRAASYDGSNIIPPGPAAWTGRGSHHIPGSAWKMVTALALIDAATDPDMPWKSRQEIQRLIQGVTRAEADQFLWKGVLAGRIGLCIPQRIVQGLVGTNDKDCPDGYFSVIKDGDRSGPQYNKTANTERFGLVQALSLSSNIWFATSLFHAERSRLTQNASNDPGNADGVGTGGGLAKTLSTLGLDRRLPLDGGRKLKLKPRDAVAIEAFETASNLRMLASAAFGQNVQAGPLVTAQTVGSIATKRNITPSLLAPIPSPPPLLRDTDLTRELLETAKAGLRSVVVRGTAKGPFKEQAPDLFATGLVGGKTGTGQRDDNSVERLSTFAGWLELRPGAPKYAISCSIVIVGTRKADGSVDAPPVCAHAVARLMNDLYQNEVSEGDGGPE